MQYKLETLSSVYFETIVSAPYLGTYTMNGDFRDRSAVAGGVNIGCTACGIFSLLATKLSFSAVLTGQMARDIQLQNVHRLVFFNDLLLLMIIIL
jgi:hypothetical protein